MCNQLIETAPMASHMLRTDETSKCASAFDGSMVDDDSDCSLSSQAPNQCTHRGTARVVSFILAGRPRLVDITSNDGLASLRRKRTDGLEETRHCHTPLHLMPNTTRPSSRSTQAASISLSSTKPPLRECTKLMANAPNVGATSTELLLRTDQFPKNYAQEVRIVSLPDKVAKAPANIAERAWLSRMNGGLRILSKTVKAIRIRAGG